MSRDCHSSIFAAFVFFALLLSACGSPSSSPSTPPAKTESSIETTETTTVPTISSFTFPGTLTAENFDLTIVSATLSDSVVLDTGIDVSIDADEGKQLLVLCIDATNTSEDVRNLGSFISYVDNNTILPHNVLGKLGERMIFMGAIHPGKTMGTYVLYQVPTAWNTFELSYVDSWTGSLSDPILISRSEIA